MCAALKFHFSSSHACGEKIEGTKKLFQKFFSYLELMRVFCAVKSWRYEAQKASMKHFTISLRTRPQQSVPKLVKLIFLYSLHKFHDTQARAHIHRGVCSQHFMAFNSLFCSFSAPLYIHFILDRARGGVCVVDAIFFRDLKMYLNFPQRLHLIPCSRVLRNFKLYAVLENVP